MSAAVATPDAVDASGFPLGVHGPPAVPCFSWGDSTRPAIPHNPGIYGRYIPVDMDANNRAANEQAIDRWCELHPGQPRPPMPRLGWSICRHGFGRIAEFDGLTEDEAKAKAKELNELTPVGEAGIGGAR